MPSEPTDESGPSGATIEPPPLPASLLEPWPVIAIGALAWLVATIAAFAIPALEGWRPVTVAGLGVGLLGTSIFLWQRDAARRGTRGAQTGLAAGRRNNDPN
jgi:hypothetical protein